MRKLVLSVFLLAIASPLAAYIRFDPPAPTSADAVTAIVGGYWSLGCKPGNPTVSMSGQTINVRLQVIGQCAHMLPALQDFSVDAPLGTLATGTYEVTVEAFEGTTRFDLGRATLVVVQAPQVIGGRRIEISPRVVFPGTPFIEIRAEGIACPPNVSPCANPVVRFNGVEATSYETVSGDAVIVRAPNLGADDTVDISIQSWAGWSANIPLAIRVADAGDPFDPSLFERILIPVIYNGPGAHGSQWRTDVWLHNHSNAAIPMLHTPEQAIGCVPPNCNVPLDARETRALAVDDAPTGYFLHVARGSSDELSVNALFRDLSQQSRALGAEMPVVREDEFIRGRSALLGIPTDIRFRTRIRAYGFPSGPETATPQVPYRIFRLNDDEVLVQGVISLVRFSETGPAFGEIADLDTAFPQISGTGPFRIEFGPAREAADDRYWVFASVTNNETQHVTLITPQ